MFQGADGAFICSDCIETAHKIIQDTIASEAKAEKLDQLSLSNLPKPADIKKILDQYVIGQDEAKKRIAVAVYNHYKRLQISNFIKAGKNSKLDPLQINVDDGFHKMKNKGIFI